MVAPAITALDEYGIVPYGQEVTITGTNFGASQGASTVELADGSTFGTATLIEQTKVKSWSDTSIVLYGLDPEMFSRGVNYLFVDHSTEGNSAGEPMFLGTRDVRVVQGTFSTPTSTGNLDVSHPRLLGDSKVKAIFLRAMLVTNENATPDVAIHMGMSDGTTQAATAANTGDGTLDNFRANWSDRCLSLVPAGGTDTPVVVASYSGAVTDGFRLNFTTVDSPNAYLVHYIVFAGEDVEAEVTAALVSAGSISGLSLTPEFGVAMTACNGLGGSDSIFLGAFGFFDDDLAQCDVGWWADQTGGAHDAIVSVASPDGCALQCVGAALTWEMTVTSIEADGFSWSSSNADNVFFLSLNLSNIGTSIQEFIKSTGTAPVTQALPDLGFVPQSFGVATAWKTTDTLTAADAQVSLGYWDGFLQGHVSWYDENVVVPNNEMRSQTDGIGLKMTTGGGVAVKVGAQQVGNDTAPDLLLDPNDAAADLMYVFAFERVAG